jgi:hypothetical protein
LRLAVLSKKKSSSLNRRRSCKSRQCRSTDLSVQPGAPRRTRQPMVRLTGGKPC